MLSGWFQGILTSVHLSTGSLFPWYLIAIIAVLALRPGRIALWHILPASTLALQFNVLSVWAWFNSAFARNSPMIHLGESLILAVPLLLLIAASLNFWPKTAPVPQHCGSLEPEMAPGINGTWNLGALCFKSRSVCGCKYLHPHTRTRLSRETFISAEA